MTVPFIIGGTLFLFAGLAIFYSRYKIIKGGTLYNAKFDRFDYPSARGGAIIFVSFICEDKLLTKPITSKWAIFPSFHKGREYKIYYNERYPNAVAERPVE